MHGTSFGPLARKSVAYCAVTLLCYACGTAAAPLPSTDTGGSETADTQVISFDSNVSPDLAATELAPETTSPEVSVDAPVDTPDAPTAALPCPGSANCPCTTASDCNSNLCIDTVAGSVCAQTCSGDCPAGQKCVNVPGASDPISLCVPAYGLRCEPCASSTECAAVGNSSAKCLSYGNVGWFCGSVCNGDVDCGPGFACQDSATAEGGSAKQCRKVDSSGNLGTCPCSVRAVAKSLTTTCGNAFDAAVCKGQRKCQTAGDTGLSACDAPAPVTEVCNDKDDDCNGLTDESGCDDGNPCTTDLCSAKAGGCSHAPADKLVCDDGNVCTLGDLCLGGTCQAGTDLCGCKVNADCASQEDGDLCNGVLFCDTGVVPYTCKLKPDSIITCDTSVDTACAVNNCDPKTGACTAKAALPGTSCSDGNLCTKGDSCLVGICQGVTDSCDDANPCTDDLCDPIAGCSHKANSAACDDGQACTLGDKCAGSQCVGGPAPSCSDAAKNGNESDEDCGGTTACGNPACGPCAVGKVCGANSDCTSQVCTGGLCAAPTCLDSVQNGSETGVDCGGSCAVCPAVLLWAGGGTTTTGIWQGNAWKTNQFPAPTVSDGQWVPLGSKGTVGAQALMRYTKIGDLNDNSLQSLMWNGQGFQAPQPVGSGIITQGQPRAVRRGDLTQLVYHGMDYKHYQVSYSGGVWSAANVVGTPQGYSPSGPALSGLGENQLMLAYFDGANGNQITARTGAGNVWNGANSIGPTADYNTAPALLQLGEKSGELLLVYLKIDAQVVFQRFTSGAWLPVADVPTAKSKVPVAIALGSDNKPVLAMQGLDGHLYIATWSGSAWSALSQVGTPAVFLQGSPALARGFNGLYEIAWVDPSGAVWHSSQGANGATVPVQLSTGALHVALLTVP